MNDEDLEWVEKWFHYYRLSKKDRAKAIEVTAVTWLDRIVEDAPERAWEIILVLVSRCPSDEVLAHIAAGPLEDLIGQHGEVIIGQVEIEARRDPRFRKCLRAVWGPSSLPPKIWARIQKACGSESPW